MGFLAIVIVGALIFSLINNNSNLKRENERLHNIINSKKKVRIWHDGYLY